MVTYYYLLVIFNILKTKKETERERGVFVGRHD